MNKWTIVILKDQADAKVIMYLLLDSMVHVQSVTSGKCQVQWMTLVERERAHHLTNEITNA